MIDYSNIAYVGSNKPLICRDGNIQYSKSMDLPFYNYNDLDLNIDKINSYKVIILDISVGWTTSEEMDIIESFVKEAKLTKSVNLFIRLVDQFEHQGSEEVYLRMRKMSIDYNIPIIRTYNVNYYDLPNQLDYIPYPYIKEDEVTRRSISTRLSNRIILSGASVKGIYPMRERLYEISKGSCTIETLGHPGYSGRHWNSGKIGNAYLDKLSNYIFMVCTTCNESYELLKYIECAEAGCIPVGEVPNSLKGTEAEKYIIQIPNEALINGDKFDSWFIEMSSRTDYHRIATSYRRCIKDLRDKSKIKNELLNVINNEIYKRLK